MRRRRAATPSSRSAIPTGPASRTRRAEMGDTAGSGALAWLLPSPYDASAASLTAHAEAIGEAMAGRGRLWLGPFAPPAELPAGYEDTAVVVPTSGSTGAAKAV